MKGARRVLYLGLALGLLMFAVPRLENGYGLTLPTLFSCIWICFSLLIIASQLHFLLGVDEEQRKELARIKRAKRAGRERLLRRYMN
ncbi:hypothetical protein SY83_21640 [Paenibacillus swuensis]|uniref:Uncharacterized protein n=1 Tax=Paenibacillus swuensis TaxID=1178515 RepID=A0A172TNY0_9BACL|nr:hypothetical protein [Paenibacillus swuensis]ANE48453.1 hypothetical protein SY83_21640 [Paenibacillus swuensis]